jgi:signal transduction histidine kinase/ActR/RegA family two-component response regulator
MILVLFVVVGLLVSIKLSDYSENRAVLEYQLNELMFERKGAVGGSTDEVEAIRRERMRKLDQDFMFDMTFAFAILVVGVAVPVMVSKYIASMVEQNLTLLGDRLSSCGREGSALMHQVFDFSEFTGVANQMRQALRERGETEQRWKRAEKELIDVNHDLLNQAQALSQGRKVAFSMMEDAEMAQRELETVNRRLNLVIEEAQASAQEADIANRAKSDFLATMSHEIRTPLNGVIGFIDMLAETDLTEEQLDYVNTVRTSGKTLMALINDILDFSKIESGHLNLELRTFNLVTMLRELVSLFFNEATQKGIVLNLELGEDVSRMIEGDEMRIRQILTNLLANAVKFTENGQVSLIVTRNSIPDETGVCLIEFEVRDTGIGISSQQLRKLFRPFSQGDSSTTRKYGGTGLGLVISKRLAEAMGGKIWATSSVDKGSSFYTCIQVRVIDSRNRVTPGVIPLKQGDDDPLKRVKSDPLDAAIEPRSQKLGEILPLRIAAAEDNQANQRVLSMMLQRLGWTADFVENGVELIEHLKANPCDLVFMDLQMPVMDGLEATRLIRAGEAGHEMRDVKIIALTANALSRDEARCLECGMDAYLSKPLKIYTLENCIADLFISKGADVTEV